jgi:hypothetical protein
MRGWTDFDPLVAQPALVTELEHLAANHGDGVVVLAEWRAVTVGITAVRRRPDGAAELKRMNLRPIARGRGIGDALVAAAIDAASELGCDPVWLETIRGAMDTAIAGCTGAMASPSPQPAAEPVAPGSRCDGAPDHACAEIRMTTTDCSAVFTHRLATVADRPALDSLAAAAIDQLQRGYLSPDQIAATRKIMGTTPASSRTAPISSSRPAACSQAAATRADGPRRTAATTQPVATTPCSTSHESRPRTGDVHPPRIRPPGRRLPRAGAM